MEVGSFVKKCQFVLVEIKHFPGQQTGNFTNVFPSHVHPIHKSTSAPIFHSWSAFRFWGFISFAWYFLFSVTSFSEDYFQKKKLNVQQCDQLSSKKKIFKLWGKMWAVPEFPLKFPLGHSGEKKPIWNSESQDL